MSSLRMTAANSVGNRTDVPLFQNVFFLLFLYYIYIYIFSVRKITVHASVC